MYDNGTGAAHALKQADDQIAGAVFRQLDAFHGNRGITAGQKAERHGRAGNRDQRVIQYLCCFCDTGGFLRTVPGAIGINETMTSAVRLGIRIGRRTEETQTDDTVIDRDTVLAVIEESSSAGGVAQRGPGMGTDLKAVGIITAGPMGRTG